MISIVICSIHKGQFNQLKDIIESTIGNVQFELLHIDNSKNDFTIAEAYNKGIKQAIYPYLLFIHEDISIHTLNWGKILLKIFEKDRKIGLIGIAGSKIKTNTPTAWWENTRENLVMNLIQQFPDGRKERIHFGFDLNKITEVVCIDGVFMAMRKESNIKFDERLKGFHNYDQAISIRCREKGFKIMVTKDILIEHFSTGNKNRDWLRSNFKFYNLYKDQLPQSIGSKLIRRKEVAYSNYRLMLNYRGAGERLKVFYFFLRTIYFDPRTKKYYKEFYKISQKFFNK